MEIEISGWKRSLAPHPPPPPLRKKAGVTDYERCVSLESRCWPPHFLPPQSFHFCAFTKKKNKTKKEAAFRSIRERSLTKCNLKLIDLLIALFPIIPVTAPTFWKRQTTLNGHD